MRKKVEDGIKSDQSCIMVWRKIEGTAKEKWIGNGGVTEEVPVGPVVLASEALAASAEEEELACLGGDG